jgi:hypothetical protein
LISIGFFPWKAESPSEARPRSRHIKLGKNVHSRPCNAIERPLDIFASPTDDPVHVPEIGFSGFVVIENDDGPCARSQPGQEVGLVGEVSDQEIFAVDVDFGKRQSEVGAHEHHVGPFSVHNPGGGESIITREMVNTNVRFPHYGHAPKRSGCACQPNQHV